MYKKSKKIIATMLLMIITLANFSNVGIYASEVLAENVSLEKQNAKTNNSNVEFNAYFVSEENKTYEATKNIGEDNKIVVDVTVKNAGYLKNTMIKFLNSNFKLTNDVNSDYISSIDTESNTVILKQINSGENVRLEIPIQFKDGETVNVVDFSLTSLVQMSGTYVDAKGKSNSVEKQISLKLNWTANAEAILQSDIAKFVPYNINGQKGLIVQTIIKSGVKDNTLPIKETKIEVEVPNINNIPPKDIKVNANTTVATNGNDSTNFDESNYTINDNKVVIDVQNAQAEDGKISWKKEGLDEYVVTAIYPEEVLNTAIDNTNIDIKVNSNIQVYNAKQDIITANVQETKQVEGQVGNIVDFTIETNEKLSKGQMYANYIASDKKEIEYTEKLTANVGFAQLVNKIEVSQSADNFKSSGRDFKADTYYKKLEVSKQNFEKILGNEGSIEVYSADTLLGTIDNSQEANESGNLVFELSEFNINNVTIKTTKPIAEGKLEIVFIKAIKTDLSYNKSTTETFENIELVAQVKALSDDLTLVEQAATASIALIEPETNTELRINNKDLSTIVTNENVELRAILKTNSVYNKLFENPKVEIELPSYISKINIKNIQLMFEDELTIGQTDCIEEKDGTKKIVVTLNGVQTKYSLDAATEGANIVITADISVDNLTPTTQSQLKMTATNGKDIQESVAEINFIAPVGIVTVNKMINNTDASEVMALTEDETSKLEVTATSKNVTSQIQVINNYSNKINNVRILGRTLMKDTTDIDTDNSLNNTFDAPMLDAIDTQGMQNVTVYYSENGNATEDLNNNSNGWTLDITDFSKVKSYLIVLNNYEMNVGDSVKFSYSAQIPENLNYSETVNSLYTVYFDNVQEEQTINDRAKSRLVTLTTGVAPTLEVRLESNSEENSTVREEQYVKFKALIKNTGTVDAENVKLNITAPSGKIYTYKDAAGKVQFTEDTSLIADPATQLVAEYSTKHTEFIQDNYTSDYEDIDAPEKTITVGTVKQGQTVAVEYELKMVNVEEYRMNALSENEKDLLLPETIIKNTVRVIADDMQKEVTSNEYNLKIAEGYVKVLVKADKFSDYTLIKGDTIDYTANVENISGTDLKNVVVKMKVPTNLEIKDTKIESATISDYELKYTVSIDKTTNIATFNIEELPIGWTINCNASTQVGDMQGDITATATVETEGGNVHYSNETSNTVSKLSFTIKQLAPEKEYMKETEQIAYTYEIENTSDVYTNSFKFENKIPDGMEFVSAEIINGDVSYSTFAQVEDTLLMNLNSFKEGVKIKIKVVMQAAKFEDGVTQKEATNYATISGNDFDTLTSNSVKTVIEYNKDVHKVDYGDGDGSDENPDDSSRYIISGLAWLDSNQNGQRDDGETLLSGIEVRLLNKNTNEIVKDVTTGAEKITRTLSTGEYTFTNLEEGEYLVIFVYNSAKYDLTQYKKSGVSDTTNSDVINIDMTIDGKETKVATSDTIKISNANARNIDIGLCESEKSDLRLDKYISAITVTYGNTVKTYSYENSKLAKVEIPAKELSNATVIIEYKIVVTNEGAIANYVRKVVDYMPKDMKFNSELNRDWYQSTNGDLYNSSLANTKLESGQSAEMALTLTKKMTDTNTGIVNNNAEIYEVYNEEGIADIDSTPANKVSSEDDMSAADVVISIKTGDAVVYTALISVVICIAIGVSAYYIRKKVLRKI